MKTHIFAFFIAISLLFFACNTDEKLSSQTEDVLPESGILELTRPIQGRSGSPFRFLFVNSEI